MTDSFTEMIKACGGEFILIFAILALAGLAAIIANIINLPRARQAAATGQKLKHFKFWPKSLKGLAVLSFLIGLLGSISGFMHLFWTLSVMQIPPVHMAYKGTYESLSTMSVGTGLTVCLFAVYYLFRWLIHRISQSNNSNKK